jgi:hypothetical protein
VTIKEYGFLTKAELDTEFAYWHGPDARPG